MRSRKARHGPAASSAHPSAEAAVFQIVEAILVAVLVAGALIFFAIVQKPAATSSAPSQDLAILAGDVLDSLTDAQLATIAGMGCSQPAVNRNGAIEARLPDGVHYAVYKGAGSTSRSVSGTTTTTTTAAQACIVQDSDDTGAAEPRNAQGAARYLVDSSYTASIQLVVWTGF